MSFGQRLREERKRLRLKQDEMAAAGEVTVQSQRMYEADKRPPSAKYLELLADVGVDTQYLFTGHRSVNREILYRQPADVLPVVVGLQDRFGRFDADQLKTLMEYAWTYQVGAEGLEEFVRSAYSFAGVSVPDGC
jgi:transcriptional regulator with XRE-family HTH domain